MNFTGIMNSENEKMLEQITHLMRRDDSADAPADAVKWAKNLFAARAAAPARQSFARRVLAVLQMDLQPNAVFGERSSSAAAVHQMLFQAGDNAVDLRIAKTGEKLHITGQILGAGYADAVVILSGTHETLETETNELSEFVFDSAAGGTYTLILRQNENEIAIENLELS